MRLLTVMIVVVFGLFAASTLHADNVLVFEDVVLGTSAIPGALTLWGGCGTCTTTNNTATFNGLLSGGGWDLVIYAEQMNMLFSGSSAELSAYVAGGGKLIGQTWYDSGLFPLMEASLNSANGDTITTSGHPIFAGLGATVSLYNPGWGVFSLGLDPVGSALGLGSLSSGGSAVILGNSGRTFLNAPLTDAYFTLSDGERLLANEIGFLSGATPVPEPATYGLLAAALALIGVMRRKK